MVALQKTKWIILQQAQQSCDTSHIAISLKPFASFNVLSTASHFDNPAFEIIDIASKACMDYTSWHFSLPKYTTRNQ